MSVQNVDDVLCSASTGSLSWSIVHRNLGTGKPVVVVVNNIAVDADRQKEKEEVREEVTEISRGFDEELLTPKQVAALFRVDPKTVNRWAQAGKIGCMITPGGHRRYRSAEVHALLRVPRNSSQ